MKEALAQLHPGEGEVVSLIGSLGMLEVPKPLKPTRCWSVVAFLA
jgi:hypothetical protein